MLKANISNDNRNVDKIAVDINRLQDMLCVGKRSADRIGEEAGAVIKIGRRKLYNVEKIKTYINNHA